LRKGGFRKKRAEGRQHKKGKRYATRVSVANKPTFWMEKFRRERGIKRRKGKKNWRDEGRTQKTSFPFAPGTEKRNECRDNTQKEERQKARFTGTGGQATFNLGPRGKGGRKGG